MILLSPLDWGLGHATRCIPIIKILKEFEANIVVAAPEPLLHLLSKEFPDLNTEVLAPLDFKWKGAFSSLLQLNKFNNHIKRDEVWCKDFVSKYKPDAIISDNRYGMHHPDIPSAIITHQLFPQSPWLKSIVHPVLHKKINTYINRFNVCWIPDDYNHTLSGELSFFNKENKIPIENIGFLSRFGVVGYEKKNEEKAIPDVLSNQDVEIVALVSGPEPQRTYFEKKLFTEFQKCSRSALILQGKPEKPFEISKYGNLFICSHLATEGLKYFLSNCQFVISRSGYSTIMDLCVTGCKAALVPTPGQTEQEYLAERMMQKGYFYSVSQKNFNLKEILNIIHAFPGYPSIFIDRILRKHLRHFLQVENRLAKMLKKRDD